MTHHDNGTSDLKLIPKHARDSSWVVHPVKAAHHTFKGKARRVSIWDYFVLRASLPSC
jgi:hypothetical protein